jgi:acyl-[acyl carrier protein]--UDP-N-acetylglucosamine O-acyltransferase
MVESNFATVNDTVYYGSSSSLLSHDIVPYISIARQQARNKGDNSIAKQRLTK